MLRIRIKGSLSKEQQVLRRAAKGGFLRPILMNVAEEAVELVKHGFATSTAPDGKSWAPLAAKRGRDKKGTKGQPLRDTGRLMNSLSRVPVVGGSGFTYGTDVSYAPYHQFGTKGHRGDHSRKQAVDSRGKFTKRGGRGKRLISGERILNFKKGGGAIGARPFLPIPVLPGPWARRFDVVIRESLDELFSR